MTANVDTRYPAAFVTARWNHRFGVQMVLSPPGANPHLGAQ